MSKRVIIIVSIFFMLCVKALAQVTPAFFLTPNQYFNHYYLINPAAKNLGKKLDLTLGNRSQTGAFAGVGSTYGNLDYSPGSKQKQSHLLGAFLSNMRKGEYIQLNRLNLRYAFTTSLSERSSLSAGISGGLVNYRLAASNASAGGSALGLDIGAGLWYFSEHVNFGASLLQVSETSLTPINETLKLNRYMNLNPEYVFSLHHTFDLALRGWYVQSLSDDLWKIIVSPVFTWKEKLDLGGGYDNRRGAYGYLGVKSLSLGQGAFSLGFSYLIISTRKFSDVNDSVVEISLAYGIGKGDTDKGRKRKRMRKRE